MYSLKPASFGHFEETGPLNGPEGQTAVRISVKPTIIIHQNN